MLKCRLGGAVQKGNRVNSNSSRPGDALGSQDASSQAYGTAGAAQGWQSRAAPAAEGEGGLAQPFGGVSSLLPKCHCKRLSLGFSYDT